MKSFVFVTTTSLILFISSSTFSAPLYKLEKNGKTNWLLGTLHRKIDPAWLPPEVVEVASKARVVFAEEGLVTDADRARIARESQLEHQKNISGPPKRNLKKALGTSDYLLLRSIFKKLGNDVAFGDYLAAHAVNDEIGQMLSDYETTLLSEFFTAVPADIAAATTDGGKAILEAQNFVDIEHEAEPHAGWEILDFAVLNISKQHEIPIFRLDEKEDTFVDAVTEADVIRNIKIYLKRLKVFKAEFKNYLPQLYALNRIGSQPNSYFRWLRSSPENPSVISLDALEAIRPPFPLRKVVNDRHELWIPRMSAEFEKGGVFVVAGSAHVHGAEDFTETKSLTQIYSELGYQVTQVHGDDKSTCELILGSGN
jgi:hypothetical protein